MSFSSGIDKKPGRWFVLTIFVGLFLIIFIQNGGLFIDSPETFVMISGDSEGMKRFLFIPVLKKHSEQEKTANPIFFQLFSMEHIEQNKDFADEYTFFFEGSRKKALLGNFSKIPERPVLGLTVISEADNAQLWEIEYRAFYYDVVRFKYAVFKNRVIPISYKRRFYVAGTLITMFSLLLSATLTFGIWKARSFIYKKNIQL